MKNSNNKIIQGAEKIKEVELGNKKTCFIGLNQPKKPTCVVKK
jgi:hypothetical protein